MEAERKTSIKTNYLYNLSYQILAIIVPLATTPYISRVLGPEALGDYAYVSANVSYFNMIAVLGTMTYAQREIAFAQADHRKRSQIFWEIFLFRAMTTLIVGIAYCLFLSRTGELKYLYAIHLLYVVAWALDISWFFQGVENFRVTVLRNALVKLASVILIFTLVRKKEDLWIYALIVCGTGTAGTLTMWPFLKDYLVRVPWRKLRPIRHMKGALALFVPVVGIQVYTVLDQTMLGVLIDTTQVGYYTQAEKIIKLASTVLYSLTAVLLPRMSAVVGSGDWKLANKYYEKTIYYSILLVLPMMTGCMLVADYLIPVFLGGEYDPCIGLLRIFSLLFITQGIGQIAGTVLITVNRQKQYTLSILSGSVLNLLLNTLLIPHFGAVGAASASVLSELCVELLMLRSLGNEFHNAVLLQAILHYLPVTLVMCVCLVIVRQFLTVSLVSLIVLGVLGCGIYGSLLLLTKDVSMQELLKRK